MPVAIIKNLMSYKFSTHTVIQFGVNLAISVPDGLFMNDTFLEQMCKTGPAHAGVEFLFGAEERNTWRSAEVDAVFELVPVVIVERLVLAMAVFGLYFHQVGVWVPVAVLGVK